MDQEDEYQPFSQTASILVDHNGEPMIPSEPSSWEQAQNDVERILYLYEQALSLSSKEKRENIQSRRARFIAMLLSPLKFTEETSYVRDDMDATIIAALHQRAKLALNQTIAFINGKLSVITLPPHLDYDGEWKSIVKNSSDPSVKYDACINLAQELCGRDLLKEALIWIDEAEKFTEDYPYRKRDIAQARGQITEPSAILIPHEAPYVSTKKAPPPSVDILYRNVDSVILSLWRIDVDAIARDFPKIDKKGQPQSEAFAIDEILSHAINSNNSKESSEKYLSKTPITATRKVAPTPEHSDKIAKLTLPETSPGLYLLKVNISKNSSLHRIININNLTLASRRCPQGIMWIVADATTGYPAKGVKIKGKVIQGDLTNDERAPFANTPESENAQKEKQMPLES